MTEEQMEDFTYAYGLWLCHPDSGLYLTMLDSFTRLAAAQKERDDLLEIYPMLRLEIAHRGDVMGIAREFHERTH